MWSLAWRGRGMHIDLTKIPDWMLDKFEEWSKEQIEAENQEAQK